MNHIEITHNPFTVITQFVINGQLPAESCKLSSYKQSRLQIWVEKLFEELSSLFNGDSDFHVTFKGVESDYIDVCEAAEVAKAQGMQIRMEWIPTSPTNIRLEQIRQLMEEAKAHPKFEAYIRENDEMRQSFEDAFNNDFDVYVVATMSSGKSTLINAMLGRDLLPAANEATTATIARITDNKSMIGQFSAKRINEQGNEINSEEDVTLETLREWNIQQDTRLIEIEGNIQAIGKRDSVRLVLTDTPGPNNSQDEDHERITMGHIQDSQRNPLILYVLNASQLGTNDDRNLLSLVAETMRKGGKQSRERFIFVINKMDVFDPENGEDIPSVLQRVQQYLTDNGIHNPQIYPISANLTRLLRKPSDQHTRKERGECSTMADLFEAEPSMDLMKYMPLTSVVKRALGNKKYSSLLLRSGLPAVETMIDEYIDKYNFPYRVNRAYQAMNRAIEIGLNEANLIEQLTKDEVALNKINEDIKILQSRREKGFDAAAYKDKVEREGKVLPEAVQGTLVQLEAENELLIETTAKEFTGKVEPRKAELKIQEAEKDLKFHFNKLVNAYEAVFIESQKAISQDLQAEYQRYVMDLFQGCQDLELPVLEGIRRTVSDISLNLSVTKQDIKTKQVVTGSYEVDHPDNVWYKPWNWGKKVTRYKYRDEEFVELAELWKAHEVRISNEFLKLLNSARKRIDAGKDILVEQYLAFMNQEFDEKFTGLLSSLQDKVNDRGVREKALEESKELLAWIKHFKTKLDNTLAV